MDTSIIRKASDFNMSAHILVGGPAGEGVIYTQPRSSGEPSLETIAKYQIAFPATGNYDFFVEYAALESRPTEFRLDMELVAGNCSGLTGGWDAQKWERQGSIGVAAGVHTLQLRRDGGPIPHIRTFKFTPT
ncbi:hypothetical protein PV762_26950 [Mitsuaria sp. CC2]|uniref:hypothetical protein n=1 Tax=Mitsuaria sp. CC2 TaxID=3029186 RepID=UPI003B8C63CC